MRHTLATIILNYRTPMLTVDCLETVVEEQRDIENSVVVVVDNCSGDSSAEKINAAIQSRGWQASVRLMESSVNGGFAAGNNLGIEAVEAEFYLLLNSDTLVRPGAIAEMLGAFEGRPNVGLVGPRLEWPDGEPQPSCFRFRTPITELQFSAGTSILYRMFPTHVGTMPVSDGPIEPDWLSFACCMIRRSVIDQVGGLDEGYFMYFDDIDFCREARLAGWSVLYWPTAHVVHLRGQSGPVKEAGAQRRRRPTYYYCSRSRYFAKVYGRLGLWWVNICWSIGRSIAFVREVFGNKKPHDCERECLDNWTNALNPIRPPRRP